MISMSIKAINEELDLGPLPRMSKDLFSPEVSFHTFIIIAIEPMNKIQ